MDVDLSTDLKALLPLIAPLLSRQSELAIGTRLARASREDTSASSSPAPTTRYCELPYTLASATPNADSKRSEQKFSTSCSPRYKPTSGSSIAELLILAQRHQLRIHEVPVDWTDDPDSRVDIIATALADLRGVARLALGTPLARFLLIGVISTPTSFPAVSDGGS
jgi:hypothetical protein